MCCRQITLSKMDKILLLAIPKQLSTISMHTPSLVKIHCYSVKLSSRNETMNVSRADTCQIDETCLSAIPKQISTISMYTPSLVKIQWHLLKLSCGNKNMDLLWAGNSVKNWWNLPINNPKPDLHNINTHKNPLKIHWHLLKLLSGNKMWLVGHMTDGWTRWTDTRTAVIP